MVAFHAADMLPMSATMIDEIRKVRESQRAADDALFAQQNRVRAEGAAARGAAATGPRLRRAGRARSSATSQR